MIPGVLFEPGMSASAFLSLIAALLPEKKKHSYIK